MYAVCPHQRTGAASAAPTAAAAGGMARRHFGPFGPTVRPGRQRVMAPILLALAAALPRALGQKSRAITTLEWPDFHRAPTLVALLVVIVCLPIYVTTLVLLIKRRKHYPIAGRGAAHLIATQIIILIQLVLYSACGLAYPFGMPCSVQFLLHYSTSITAGVAYTLRAWTFAFRLEIMTFLAESKWREEKRQLLSVHREKLGEDATVPLVTSRQPKGTHLTIKVDPSDAAGNPTDEVDESPVPGAWFIHHRRWIEPSFLRPFIAVFGVICVICAVLLARFDFDVQWTNENFRKTGVLQPGDPDTPGQFYVDTWLNAPTCLAYSVKTISFQVVIMLMVIPILLWCAWRMRIDKKRREARTKDQEAVFRLTHDGKEMPKAPSSIIGGIDMDDAQNVKSELLIVVISVQILSGGYFPLQMYAPEWQFLNLNATFALLSAVSVVWPLWMSFAISRRHRALLGTGSGNKVRSLGDRLPHHQRYYTLKFIISNPRAYSVLLTFLQKEYSSENALFYTEARSFERAAKMLEARIPNWPSSIDDDDDAADDRTTEAGEARSRVGRTAVDGVVAFRPRASPSSRRAGGGPMRIVTSSKTGPTGRLPAGTSLPPSPNPSGTPPGPSPVPLTPSIFPGFPDDAAALLLPHVPMFAHAPSDAGSTVVALGPMSPAAAVAVEDDLQVTEAFSPSFSPDTVKGRRHHSRDSTTITTTTGSQLNSPTLTATHDAIRPFDEAHHQPTKENARMYNTSDNGHPEATGGQPPLHHALSTTHYLSHHRSSHSGAGNPNAATHQSRNSGDGHAGGLVTLMEADTAEGEGTDGMVVSDRARQRYAVPASPITSSHSGSGGGDTSVDFSSLHLEALRLKAWSATIARNYLVRAATYEINIAEDLSKLVLGQIHQLTSWNPSPDGMDAPSYPHPPPFPLSTLYRATCLSVFQLLEKDSFRRFLLTPGFQGLLAKADEEELARVEQQVDLTHDTAAQIDKAVKALAATGHQGERTPSAPTSPNHQVTSPGGGSGRGVGGGGVGGRVTSIPLVSVSTSSSSYIRTGVTAAASSGGDTTIGVGPTPTSTGTGPLTLTLTRPPAAATPSLSSGSPLVAAAASAVPASGTRLSRDADVASLLSPTPPPAHHRGGSHSRTRSASGAHAEGQAQAGSVGVAPVLVSAAGGTASSSTSSSSSSSGGPGVVDVKRQ